MTPKEAEAELRRLLEHDALKAPTPRTPQGTFVTFADAAEAWLEHGERKRKHLAVWLGRGEITSGDLQVKRGMERAERCANPLVMPAAPLSLA